jgi:hypothetical protein
MSEWQPAWYVNAHGSGILPDNQRALREGDRIFVRPIETPIEVQKLYKSIAGCDSEHFFEVSFNGKSNAFGYYEGMGPMAVCEHEILTD